MRGPIRVASCPFSFRAALAEHVGKKRARVDAMRGVVRAGVDAARFFQVRAEIARSRFLLDRRLLVPGSLRIVDHHFEGVQIDVAVRTVLRAEAAADAPILDDDFQRIAPSNRTDRTADHAEWIAALPATRGDEILIETQTIADEPGDAVVRVGAGVDASIAARAILQIQNQQALRFHQSLREKLVDGDVVNHLQALLIGGVAFCGNGFEACSHAGETRDHIAEIVTGDADKFDVVESGASSGSNATAKQADFAEVIAARKIGEHQFPAGIILRDFHKSDAHQIETVRRHSLLNDDLSWGEALKLDALFQMLDEFRRKVREHGHTAKVIFERTAAIGLVELRAESFVLQHDVENVAQHLESHDIGLRGDRSGARIKIHARHFAEEIPGAEFGDGIAVSEVNRGVDGNGSVACFFLALVFLARDERAAQPLEKSFGAALRLDVRDGRGDGNFGLAFENVESRGAELAFAADDFAFAEAPFDDGAAVELQEGSGDTFKYRNLQQVFGFESLRVQPCSNRRSHDTLVRERPGGAGDHALATGDARGIANGRIEIESDAGGIAFAHASENEIVLDFVATADAAVAENASVMVDGDGQGRIIFAVLDGAFCKTRMGSAGSLRERFQFAVTGILLARARGRVIGH